jgi:hypothetical protein
LARGVRALFILARLARYLHDHVEVNAALEDTRNRIAAFSFLLGRRKRLPARASSGRFTAMTLVLSFATPHYVIQVADRRISHLSSGSVMPDANKSVMLCNRMAFAYTGMAVLESQPTSVWLWNVIKELEKPCSTSDVIKHITKRAEIAVKNTNRVHYPQDEQLCQTFIGAGWAQLPEHDGLLPIFCRITNCHDSTGQRISLPTKEFRCQEQIWGNNKCGWTETGTPLAKKERDLLARRMKKCAKKGTGPAAPIRLFCDAIWKVHRRQPNIVSDNLLIVMIPRSAAMRHSITLLTGGSGPRSGIQMISSGCREANEPLLPEHMSLFAYIPSPLERPIQYGPLMACPGRGSFSDLTVGVMKP